MIAKKDADASFGIRFESFERGDKLRRCFWIDGVPRVRAAQDHRRNGPFFSEVTVMAACYPTLMQQPPLGSA